MIASPFPEKLTWDEQKNRTNSDKHGVSFDEAAGLFTSGADYLELYDEEHSMQEDRFIAIGPIRKGVVVVVYTARDEDTVRIISARWATQRETERYHTTMSRWT